MPQRIWNHMFLDPGIGSWSFHQSNSTDYNKSATTTVFPAPTFKARQTVPYELKKKTSAYVILSTLLLSKPIIQIPYWAVTLQLLFKHVLMCFIYIKCYINMFSYDICFCM